MLLIALSLGLLAICFAPTAASAAHGQVTYFEGGNELLEPNTRPRALAQLESLGVNALRVELPWADVAPAASSASKPAFEAANPAAYDWGQFDVLLSEAARLRWRVLLTVTAPAPRWATSNRKAPYVTRPDDKDFEEFMTAVGEHYATEVSAFAIWNEPNHPAFLMPQWKANGTPASPRIYRGLYQAGYAGLKAAGLTHPTVLFGETAPTGYDKVNPRHERAAAYLRDVAPLAFLRESLCLNAKYRRAGACSELRISGYAHHGYSKAAGPKYVPLEPDNVTIGSLSRLSRALDKAAAAHAIPHGVPIFLTEFGVQSKPNKFEGVSPTKQAEYDAIAEHIAYENPRVAAFSQYLLRDDALGGKPGSSVHGGTVGFQTGLQYQNGALKPLYFAFPVPLTVTRHGHDVALWGLVRPATGATKVTVLVRRKGSRRFQRLRTVTTNASGYWSFDSGVAGQAWRVLWKSPAGKRYEGPPIGVSG
ncbi:MAG TPA: hypothetical protein VGG08_06815 [Solirubrobacteraceae bacterium]